LNSDSAFTFLQHGERRKRRQRRRRQRRRRSRRKQNKNAATTTKVEGRNTRRRNKHLFCGLEFGFGINLEL